ncbi:MAG: hypothetical protein K2M12_08915 [Muribaculaceae bacterium]|nr:hypothetical protein [Muribaculaceae bacterium]
MRSLHKFLFAAAAGLCAHGAAAVSLGDIVARLDSLTPYHASARYEVLLPQYEDPVSYTVALNSTAAPADTLSPCDYLIDWTLRMPEGESRGFNAYAAGHHYRYRDKRLQEYHADADAVPFAPQRRVGLGVQQQAQFVQLLPQYVAARLREMLADTCYSYTVRPSAGGATVAVEGSQSYAGVEAMTFSYVFAAADGMRPVASEFCYNPAQMSEQTVSVKYGPATADAMQAYDEAALMALYPEAFGRYRDSNYTLERLPGLPLPEFSATTLSGNRYTHERGHGFATPVVVCILDPAIAGTAGLVADMRRAVDESPVAASAILAFVSSHPDDIAAVVGTPRPDEVVLSGARSLARSSGATATPTIIIAGPDGIVKNVHVGFNKELREIVMQEITLAK